mmetsp:Transcript_11424/g.24188  ORF Transcript_11424/g.24188 Transcript_11424/m.24188 type:complete len:238 (+) Transcript_11424:1935-2648(+)
MLHAQASSSDWAERVAALPKAADRAPAVPGALLEERRAHRVHKVDLQGNAQDVAGVAPRLPGVPLQVPLPALRRHPCELHPDEELDAQRLPEEHEAARPLHSKPQGGPPARDFGVPKDRRGLQRFPDGPAGPSEHVLEHEAARELFVGAPPAAPLAAGRGPEHGHQVQRAPDQRARPLHRHERHPQGAGHSDGDVPAARLRAGRRGQVLGPECDRQPAQVPQQPHALLQLRPPLPLW